MFMIKKVQAKKKTYVQCDLNFIIKNIYMDYPSILSVSSELSIINTKHILCYNLKKN